MFEEVEELCAKLQRGALTAARRGERRVLNKCQIEIVEHRLSIPEITSEVNLLGYTVSGVVKSRTESLGGLKLQSRSRE